MRNSLTIYHDFEHVFIKLDYLYQSSIVGLYPYDDNLDDGSYKTVESATYNALYTLSAQSILSATSYYFNYVSSGRIKSAKVFFEVTGFAYFNWAMVREVAELDQNYMVVDEILAKNYSKEKLSEIDSKVFDISDEKAEIIHQRISQLKNTCDIEYRYELFGNNCIDFAQEMYSLAGLEGDHFNVMHPDTYPISILGAFKASMDFSSFVSQMIDSA